MRSILLAVALLFVASSAQAERYYSRTVVRGCTTAQADADEMARTGILRHRGGCGCREGIGMGASPEQALSNCCFYGRYAVREKAVSRGVNGRWYAVVRYAQ
jgi:hypothetical protein